MPGTNFRSIGAPSNKSNVTNRFGDRDFILAVCTCFLSNFDRFEVIRDFRSLIHGGIPFPVDGSIAEQMWRHYSISCWRFRYAFCRNFPSILFRWKVIQEFHACAMVKIFFNFWGQIWPLKISLQISRPPKGTSLRKSASIEALWSSWLFPFGL